MKKKTKARSPKDTGPGPDDPAISDDEIKRRLTLAFAKGAAEDEALIEKHKGEPVPEKYMPWPHDDDHIPDPK